MKQHVQVTAVEVNVLASAMGIQSQLQVEKSEVQVEMVYFISLPLRRHL
jgi:hypothetical protein